MLQDSLKVAEKAVTHSSNHIETTDIWLWVAVAEFVIILVFILVFIIKRKPNKKRSIRKRVLSDNVDFDNIIDSSFHSPELYDMLMKKCHPDRFPTDLKLNSIANRLFQEISENKTNLKRLEELKIEAQEKLDINF